MKFRLAKKSISIHFHFGVGLDVWCDRVSVLTGFLIHFRLKASLDRTELFISCLDLDSNKFFEHEIYRFGWIASNGQHTRKITNFQMTRSFQKDSFSKWRYTLFDLYVLFLFFILASVFWAIYITFFYVLCAVCFVILYVQISFPNARLWLFINQLSLNSDTQHTHTHFKSIICWFFFIDRPINAAL